MKRSVLGIPVALFIYFASYLIFRKCYETREDELITLYDEDSVVALFAHLIHTPLIYGDNELTGRIVKVGNWREPLPPESIREIEERRNSGNEIDE